MGEKSGSDPGNRTPNSAATKRRDTIVTKPEVQDGRFELPSARWERAVMTKLDQSRLSKEGTNAARQVMLVAKPGGGLWVQNETTVASFPGCIIFKVSKPSAENHTLFRGTRGDGTHCSLQSARAGSIMASTRPSEGRNPGSIPGQPSFPTRHHGATG